MSATAHRPEPAGTPHPVLSDVLEHVDDPGAKPDVAIPNGCGPNEIEQFLLRKLILWPLLSRSCAAARVRSA